jgi:drug/metabolite transporter (DMT)-like permease
MAVVLGLLAAVTYGTADFLGGLATKRNPVVRVVLVSQAIGLLAYLAAVPLLPEGRFTGEAWAWGAAAGAAGAVGIAFLYRGLARGRMSVVAPITAVISVSIPVLVGLALGERPTGFQLLGVAAVVPAVGLVSAAPEPAASGSPGGVRTARAGVLDALTSGVGIGLFLVALSRAGEETGPWPLVAARIASLAVFGVGMVVAGHGLRPARGTGRTVVGAGILDVTANLLYLLGTRAGLVSIVAALTSLYPAATVVLARGVLKERLSRGQLAGLVVALAGVVLISAG